MSSINDLIAAHERLTTVLKPNPSPSQDASAAVHDVKELYISHKHRECSKRAVIYLSRLGSNAHPLHRAALYFYAGLSYDTLARNTPYRSAQIFGTLDQAQLFYQHAIEALEVPELQREKLARGSSSPVKPLSLLNWSVPATASSHIPRLRRSATSLAELTIDEEQAATRLKTPSRKTLARMHPTQASSSSSPPSPRHLPAAPPPSPEVKIRSPRKISSLTYLAVSPQAHAHRTAGRSSSDGTASSSSASNSNSNSTGKATAAPPRPASGARQVRFNENLDAFAGLVDAHAASVARFRSVVLAKQAQEHTPVPGLASGRFRAAGGGRTASSSPDAAGGAAVLRMGWDEMVVRIDRLRARNWAMPRFDAERYEELRERAMGDLES